MRRFVLAALVLLVHAPAAAQVCTLPSYVRSTCPAGSTGAECSAVGDALNLTQTDRVLGNVVNVCSASAEDWPTGCSDGQVLAASSGALVCADAATGDVVAAGVGGGQTIIGGTGAGEDLTLRGTSNATPGSILVPAGNLELPTDGSRCLSFNSSNAGLGASGNTLLLFSNAGATPIGHVRGNGICAVNGSSRFGCLAPVDPSTTVPNIRPDGIFDSGTGLGSGGTGQMSLIAGSTEVARLTSSAFAAKQPIVTYTASDAPICTQGSIYTDTDGPGLCWCDGSSWVLIGGSGTCA